MTAAPGAEGRTGVERHPAAVEEHGRGVVTEAQRAAVEPGEIGGLTGLVADGGQMLGEQRREEPTVVVQAGQQGVEPLAAVAEGGGVSDHAEVAGADTGPERNAGEVSRRGRAGDQQRTAQAGQVPPLGGGHQRQAVLGARHREVRHEARSPEHHRSVDLVGDHPHPVPLGQVGDGGQLVRGVQDAGRVVRAAQQVRRRPPTGTSLPERVLKRAEVDPQVPAERCLHDPAAGVRHELVERWVDRAVDDHRVPRLGDQPQRLDDAVHHVGHQRRTFHRQPVPTPPPPGELRQRLRVRRAGGVTGVAARDSVGDRGGDRLGQRHVHLGHPERQHVVGVLPPLEARPLPELVDRELTKGIHRVARRVQHATHGQSLFGEPAARRTPFTVRRTTRCRALDLG